MGTLYWWLAMPCMVTFFVLLVVPLGVISIYFSIFQPIMIGYWGTPALIAGLAMVVMILFALDEVIAMGQFLYWAHCRGKPLIRTFFKGDAVDRGEEYTSDALSASPTAAWAEARRGVALPWTLTFSTVIGAFLMLTRLVSGPEGAMRSKESGVGKRGGSSC